jgi:hypothetical protein
MERDESDSAVEEISLKKMQNETLLESDVNIEITGTDRNFILFSYNLKKLDVFQIIKT